MKNTIIPNNQIPNNLQSLDELNKTDSIYIYGAGECGKNVFAALKINGFVNVEGFIDTHKKGFCMGLKISDKSFVENPVTKKSILLIASMDSSNILIHIGNHKFKKIYNAYSIYNEFKTKNNKNTVKTVAPFFKDKFVSKANHTKYIESHIPQISLHVTNRCVHGCTYCISGDLSKIKVDSIIDMIGIDEYLKRVIELSNGHQIRYRIIGGEPLEHPHIEKLVEGLLSSGNFVQIQTHGLYIKKIKKVMDKLPNDYRKRFHLEPSFHLGAYLDDNHLKRLDFYRKECFPIFAEVSSYINLIFPLVPNVLFFDKLDEILNEFILISIAAKIKYELFPIVMYGDYNGKSYPKDYTDNEKERILELVQKYQPNEFESEKALSLSKIGENNLYLRGIKCYQMTNRYHVMADGKITSCGAGQPETDGTLYHIVHDIPTGLFNEIKALPCRFSKCACVTEGRKSALIPNDISLKEYLNAVKSLS